VVELALPLSCRIVRAGCCLQIIYASDLVRDANQNAEAQQETAPSIGKTEAAQLFRLSINAAALIG